MANKKSRSIEEQIELLKQRGMIVGDEAFAARHLAHIRDQRKNLRDSYITHKF